jgi:hypothetical protein
MPYEQRQRLPDDWLEYEWTIPPEQTETEWYQRTFAAPSAPDGNAAFAGGRESTNVIDKRGEPMGLREQLHAYEEDRYGRKTAPHGKWLRNRPAIENRHTQAVDGLVERLEGYQGSAPSRAKLIAPNNINNAVAADMQKYYGAQLGEDAYDRLMRKLADEKMTAAYGSRY